MKPFALLGACGALAALMSAPAARADVTPEDVWQNISAFAESLGGTLVASVTPVAGALRISDLSITWDWPMESGQVQISQTGFDLVDQGDGTVAFRYPETLTYHLRADFEGEMADVFSLDVAHSGLRTLASGTPEEVTYAYGADRVGFEIGSGEEAGPETPEFGLRGSVATLDGTVTVGVDSLVTVIGEMRSGTQSLTGSFVVEDAISEWSFEADSVASVSEFALPRDGIDVLFLADAFDRGLRFSGRGEARGYRREQRTTIRDQVIAEQSETARLYASGMSIDGDRFTVDGVVREVTTGFRIQDLLDLPFELRVEAAETRVSLPIAASDDLQQADIAMSIEGMTIGEPLWALFDPGQSLPRDPMHLEFDLSVDVRSHVNWFDFTDLGERLDAGEMPGELHGVTLNALRLAAAGASLTGEGSAEFDNSDLDTFDGFPKPVGRLKMVLNGSDALLRRLVDIGVLPEEQAMAARMGISMIAKQDPSGGEDVLRSEMELTEEGHVLANGIRLR